MSAKIITATLAAMLLMTTALATTAEAKMGWGGPKWGSHHGRGWGVGVPVAAGLLGLAAVGAAAGPDCYIANQPVSDGWGNVYYRRVRVCN